MWREHIHEEEARCTHRPNLSASTRKLIGENLPATGVGFWFALGHSSVVFALALLIALGVNAVAGPVQDSGSGLQHSLGIVGPAVAGTFLVLAAGSAAFTLPWYAILVLPVLFAAGMTVFDTAAGVVMAQAYRWAFINPLRKAFYNLTVTLLSVLAAFGIGALLLVQILVVELTVTGGPLAWAAALDREHAGYALAGLLVTTWLTSAASWRFGRIEERWNTP